MWIWGDPIYSGSPDRNVYENSIQKLFQKRGTHLNHALSGQLQLPQENRQAWLLFSHLKKHGHWDMTRKQSKQGWTSPAGCFDKIIQLKWRITGFAIYLWKPSRVWWRDCGNQNFQCGIYWSVKFAISMPKWIF